MLRELEAKEVCAVYVVEMEGRAGVGGFSGDFDVAEFEVAHVARDRCQSPGRSPNMVGSGYLSAFSCGWIAAISAPAPPIWCR